MDLNYHARVKFARTLAGNAGLSLVEEEVDRPRTSGKTVYVPKYQSSWNEGSDEYVSWWYSFLHEIRHNNHMDDFSIIRENNINMLSEFGFIHNLNIDHNIENCGRGVHIGIDKMLMTGRALFLEKQRQVRATFTDPQPKMDALWCMDTMVRSGWNSNIHIADKLIEELDDEAVEYLEKLLPFKAEWQKEKGADESYDLSKRIAHALDIEDKTQEQAGKGKGGEESSDEKGEESDGEMLGGVIDYLDMLEHTHDEEGSKDPCNIKIDYKNWTKSTGWIPGEMEVRHPKGEYTASGLIDEVNGFSGGEMMADEMRQYLQVMTQSRIETGYKSGRLDGSRLWKHRAYGAYSDAGSSVFKRQLEDEQLDSAVFILVDGSGSMCGDKYAHAVKASMLLNTTLKELDIATAIHSFTDESKCIQLIHKEFDDDILDSELLESFAKARYEMASNADGDNILYSAGRLLERKEKKKILIVLSDGSPAASSGYGDIYGWTKDVVKEIEDDGDIEIYGIGILDSTVEHIYSNSEVIRHPEELEPTLINLLKEHVLL